MKRSKTKHSICYFSVRISTPFLSSASHRIYRILVIVFFFSLFFGRAVQLGKTEASGGKNENLEKLTVKRREEGKNNKKMTENLIIFLRPTHFSSPHPSAPSHFLSHSSLFPPRMMLASIPDDAIILFISVSKKYFLDIYFFSAVFLF